MDDITREEKMRELIREIAIRQGYYAKVITQVPRRKEELLRRIEVMKAILEDYQRETKTHARPLGREKATSRG